MESKKGFLMLYVALFFVGACTQVATDDQADAALSADTSIIGLSMGSLQEGRWLVDEREFVEAANGLGAEVIVLTSNNNADLQKAQLKDLILQGVDVLVVIPHDATSLSEEVAMAADRGIPVISYDRLLTDTPVDMYISFDNEKVGELEARSVVDKISSGRFMYIGGSLTDNNAILLKNGSMKVLQPLIDDGSIELVYEEFTENWEPEVAYGNVKSYLDDNNGEIDAIVAANDGTAFGSIKALEEYDLDGIVPVSGQDAELSACRRIIAGTQTATVYKPIHALASKAAEVAVRMSRGEKVEPNAEVYNGYMDVPSYLIEPTLITIDNINDTIIADGFHSVQEVYGQE